MRHNLLALAVILVLGAPAVAEEVSWERLLGGGTQAEAANWLVGSGDLAGQRYSPLKQIDRENVSELTLAFTVPAPIGFGGACDFVHFRGTGAQGVVMGPGDLAVAHAPDEFVPRRELEAAVPIYRDIALSVLGRR